MDRRLTSGRLLSVWPKLLPRSHCFEPETGSALPLDLAGKSLQRFRGGSVARRFFAMRTRLFEIVGGLGAALFLTRPTPLVQGHLSRRP